VVFGTHRRLDGREEITTEQPIARDDTQASGLISHDSPSFSSKADADR
jgi:hypothetical protein